MLIIVLTWAFIVHVTIIFLIAGSPSMSVTRTREWFVD